MTAQMHAIQTHIQYTFVHIFYIRLYISQNYNAMQYVAVCRQCGATIEKHLLNKI